jgi:hypothetical protein
VASTPTMFVTADDDFPLGMVNLSPDECLGMSNSVAETCLESNDWEQS